MLNVLVIDDNFHFAKSLINNISKNNSNVRCCYIATDGKEAIEILNSNYNIDIIILDLLLPIVSGLDILKKIELEYTNRFNNSIIIISGQIDMLSQIRNNTLVFSYIFKGSGMERMITEINSLAKSKEKNYKVEKLIVNELTYLGYNLAHKGSQYLIDAISILYNSNPKSNIRLKKDIYPQLAQKYNTNIDNIKVDISKATDYMYYGCIESVIKDYFGYYIDDKPKPKLVINTILNKLKYEIL